MVAIVSRSGTFVNKLTTSNEIATYPIGAFVVLMLSTKSFVFRTVYLDFDSGARRLHMY